MCMATPKPIKSEALGVQTEWVLPAENSTQLILLSARMKGTGSQAAIGMCGLPSASPPPRPPPQNTELVSASLQGPQSI